jgi:heme oxygenase (biliverdin-IX-beta and delta-forming)
MVPPSKGSPGQSTGFLHKALREATREIHGRVDHHPVLAPLVRSDLSRSDYERIVRCLTAILLQLDPPLHAAVSCHFGSDDFQPSPRLDWLHADLRALGTQMTATVLAIGRPLHQPASAAETIGMLYALEGSTLGGRIVARLLHRHLGLTATNGAAYFSGHGDATEARWQVFWNFANASCPNKQVEAAARGAVAIFTDFLALLDESAKVLR